MSKTAHAEASGNAAGTASFGEHAKISGALHEGKGCGRRRRRVRRGRTCRTSTEDPLKDWVKISIDIRELFTEDKFTASFIKERARLYCASAI